MSGKKGVNVEFLDEKSRLLEAGAQDLDDLTSQVAGLQGPLEDCWQGAEGEACIEFINNLSLKMGKMSEQIRKINDWVNSVSKSYQEDAENGRRAYEI
ncbi:Uncharacterized conserved protein YukE [Butyrivibrio hungatei]|uniref:Uncharacterized conserved protein YukE n=1 Tax=Butyrivibrio hungatei TaxID=185008 RepID=A0A1G5G351_9FIRM|nr:WXG100 family type VII secretion target [Butyrivibrio hungatei]MBQ4220897.1 WXG100 family type VII secretion target [Butyrivibrio sp.]MEE3471501.1 WXG100 family type VII secretion target [Butyrivibrio hungatei]SCY45924.1 Uncharacterized conserved protein YukE [Butyrivibrio hungatei]